MLKGDIYDTIAAMPVKHHQRHRFDNYLYLYQYNIIIKYYYYCFLIDLLIHNLIIVQMFQS